jgi:hypothetical protein
MPDFDILRESGADSLSVVIDRKDVEASNVGPAFAVLKRLLQDRQTVEAFRGRLDLGFHGYDDDSRELYEIDEVRRFVAELDKKFPFWLYFLNLYSGTLALIHLCLCRYSKRSDRMLVLDEGDRERFLAEHYMAVNWLFVTYGMDEKDNEALTMQISAYFEKRTKPPTIQ